MTFSHPLKSVAARAARLAVGTALGSALALSWATAPVAAQEAPAVAAPATATTADPALWVVRDADSTIYLFGTVHLLRPEVDWRSDKVDAALAASDELWLEIADVDDQAAAMPLIQRYGLAPADQPLSSTLTEEDRAKLDAAAGAIGASAAAMEPFRPWLAALQVSVAAIVRAGYDPESGVDPKIKAAAVAAGKPVKGLETMEQQFGFFANLPLETQVEFLRQALDGYEDAPTELDQMVDAWVRGDIDAIDQIIVEDMKVEWGDVYEVLLVDRNADWTGQIQEMLEGSGTAFIAVGAAHLAGDDSVQAMLQQQGVTVERQ
ncbi:TraB/GumN family protein [Brevundimonas lutea]|uniref:TraB/GumN family protein n=1 Tax=Brevundimonas lutea TaxID=2293980 RepID=UPI000F03A594|nr:TraB/GumN family protein [Brevundimonas lutea]